MKRELTGCRSREATMCGTWSLARAIQHMLHLDRTTKARRRRREGRLARYRQNDKPQEETVEEEPVKEEPPAAPQQEETPPKPEAPKEGWLDFHFGIREELVKATPQEASPQEASPQKEAWWEMPAVVTPSLPSIDIPHYVQVLVTPSKDVAEAPASEAPASEAPASEAPASEAPASEAPTSEQTQEPPADLAYRSETFDEVQTWQTTWVGDDQNVDVAHVLSFVGSAVDLIAFKIAFRVRWTPHLAASLESFAPGQSEGWLKRPVKGRPDQWVRRYLQIEKKELISFYQCQSKRMNTLDLSKVADVTLDDDKIRINLKKHNGYVLAATDADLARKWCRALNRARAGFFV